MTFHEFEIKEKEKYKIIDEKAASVLSYGFIRGEVYNIIVKCMLNTETYDTFSNPWDMAGCSHHTLDIFRKE